MSTTKRTPRRYQNRKAIRSRLIISTLAVLLGGLSLASGQPVGATVGPSNNFGSDNSVGDVSSAIFLNDGRYVDWSIWWNFIAGQWTWAQVSTANSVIGTGMEYYEPLDLEVTRGADGSDQDVIVVPTNTNPNDIASTTCRFGVPNLAIYGAHHHRVCDRKQITIYMGTWGYPLGVMVYNIVSHEMGHAVGLRHSNSPCPNLDSYCRGVGTTGNPEWNSHTQPGTDSLMWYGLGTPAATSINIQDAYNINLHY